MTYLPLESLDEEYLQSVGNKYGGSAQELEPPTLLLMDDLQFLSGKERLQDELLTVINRLMPAGRQVVMTADRAPQGDPRAAGPAHLEGGVGPGGGPRSPGPGQPAGHPAEAWPRAG